MRTAGLTNRLPKALPPSVGRGLQELTTPPASQVPALDVLRSAAILLVITGHFAFVGGEVFSSRAAVFRTAPFWFGWTGVDLFFVLSGLLIGRQLWRELARTGSIDVRAFILRRGMRIWPLYYAAVALSPVTTATWTYRWSDWVFLSNYFDCRVEGGWSLSTEEQFYIVAPLFIVFAARAFRPRAWLAFIPIGLAVVELIRWQTARVLLRTLSTHDVKQAMYTPFHLHNEGLAVGLFIALLAVYYPDWISGDAAHRVRTAFMIMAMLGLAAMLRRTDDVVFPFLSLALIYGAVTVALLALGPGRLALLGAWPFYAISRLSYGMYLNHFAVLRWITPSLARLARHAGGENVVTILLSLGATVACSALIACVTFVFIERPFLLLRERLTHRTSIARGPDVVPSRARARPALARRAIRPG